MVVTSEVGGCDKRGEWPIDVRRNKSRSSIVVSASFPHSLKAAERMILMHVFILDPEATPNNFGESFLYCQTLKILNVKNYLLSTPISTLSLPSQQEVFQDQNI